MKALTPYEFFYIISPPEIISQYIAYLKHYIGKTIGHFESEYSRAHISLIRYIDEHNDNLLYFLEPSLIQFSPFEVLVKNFRVFHNGVNRTVYLDIPYRWAIDDLAKLLRIKNLTPHITIAKNLTPIQFDKVQKLLERESFSHCFMCNHITVLKRIPGEHWNNYLNLSLNQCKERSYRFDAREQMLKVPHFISL